MSNLKTLETKEDIPAIYQGTPIESLILYHNLSEPHRSHDKPELLVGTCMDYRIKLNMPEKFTYVIREGGADLRNSDFKVSYAIAMAGVKHIAMIGHTQCAMVNLDSRKDQFIKGLCDHAGWDAKKAEEHFTQDAPKSEIQNEIDFIMSETEHLEKKYPKVTVAPFLYKVEDHRLYLIEKL